MQCCQGAECCRHRSDQDTGALLLRAPSALSASDLQPVYPAAILNSKPLGAPQAQMIPVPGSSPDLSDHTTPSGGGHRAAGAPVLPGMRVPAKNANGRGKLGGSSIYRGVTKHSTTGRYEAHLWDSASIRPKTVGATACAYRPMQQLHRAPQHGCIADCIVTCLSANSQQHVGYAQSKGGRTRGKQVYLGGYRQASYPMLSWINL